MSDPAASEAELHNAVARADRARRGRDASLRLWLAAPLAATACFALAVAGRLAGWRPSLTLTALAVAALALGAYAIAARRHRAITDHDVSHIDADAGLHGELRSAHWFAAAPDRDDWIQFHLARAAERVRAVDWASLYPAPAAGKAKGATGLMAVAAIALAILIPGRAGIAASGAGPGKGAVAVKPGVIVSIPPELRKQLEEMLAAAERGQGRALSADEVRDLLAKLEDLARNPSKQDAAATPGEPPANQADIKAFAERAKKASEATSLEPEVREALSDVAKKLGDKGDENTAAMSARDPQDAAAKGDPAGGQAQQSKSGSGKEESSVQSAKEAAGGSAVGVMMMTNDQAGSSREGGLGLGGGSVDRNGGGQLADLGAVLRRETIEANADTPGENVEVAERRKTEQA